MTKTIEVSGKTEDEAIESALEQLNLTRDDVSVEIIERAKSGFLGLKNTPAIVRVMYEEKDNTAAQVENFLSGLFERMGVEATMEIGEGEGSVDVVIRASEPGALIGRRGETLDAIQHLANYSLNRTGADRTRVNIDAENYRQRRNETLENLATRTAGRVMKYRRNMTLDPMNAYERHVIHSALQSYENISTYSVGAEPNRRIVVAYSRNGEARENDGRSSDRPDNRNNNRSNNNNNSRSNDNRSYDNRNQNQNTSDSNVSRNDENEASSNSQQQQPRHREWS
ncbi:MAG: protein jag [Oscillospiraceae bacterium]|nr:protein jag [Oscillospiraceae bacterium]